mmetsp:Transcript_87471/g.234251  ORF Transcript_87471/g.234251 Transcript_87471/m.234251 type:complete len:243 (+) Transcript_87471:645-1373(+)
MHSPASPETKAISPMTKKPHLKVKRDVLLNHHRFTKQSGLEQPVRELIRQLVHSLELPDGCPFPGPTKLHHSRCNGLPVTLLGRSSSRPIGLSFSQGLQTVHGHLRGSAGIRKNLHAAHLGSSRDVKLGEDRQLRLPRFGCNHGVQMGVVGKTSVNAFAFERLHQFNQRLSFHVPSEGRIRAVLPFNWPQIVKPGLVDSPHSAMHSRGVIAQYAHLPGVLDERRPDLIASTLCGAANAHCVV